MANESFFFRTPEVDISKYKIDRFRPNAYVKVTGYGHQKTPLDTPLTLPAHPGHRSDNFSANFGAATYNPNGRPAPTLGGVKVSLEGTAASLRKCELKFTCYTVEQFDTYHEAFLKPGCKIQIEYGYSNDDRTPTARNEFVVYTFDFKMTKENFVECSLKAVGQGNQLEKTPMSAGTSAAAAAAKELEFVSNYEGGNEKKKVSTFSQWLKYDVQNDYKKLNSNTFDVRGGSYFYANYAPFNGRGVHCVYEADTDTAGEYGGWADNSRLIYFSLEYVVHKLNEWTATPKNKGKVVFGPQPPPNMIIPYTYTSELNPNGRTMYIPLPSSDPLSIGFVHTNGVWDTWPTHPTEIDSNYYGRALYRKSVMLGSYQGRGFHWHTCKGWPKFAIDKHGYRSILVSQLLIAQIEKSFLKNTDTADANTGESMLSVKAFLDTLFKKIKTCSAGHIDLYLTNDPDEFGIESTIKDVELLYIIDKNVGPGPQKPKALEFDPLNGDGITRQLGLTGKVPKSVQQAAFVGATGTSGDSGRADNAMAGGADDTESDNPLDQFIWNKLFAAQEGFYSKFDDSEAVSGMQSFVEEVRQRVSTENLVKSNFTAKYPLELSIELQGVNGFRYGDLITSKLLPGVYRDPQNKMRLGFTVTAIYHSIKDGDWSTTLKAVCRLYEA